MCVVTVLNSGIYIQVDDVKTKTKKKHTHTGVKGEDKRAALSTKRLLFYLYAEWSSLHLNVSSTLKFLKTVFKFHVIFCVVLCSQSSKIECEALDFTGNPYRSSVGCSCVMFGFVF